MANLSHNKTTLRSLERGDLVEFDRGFYSHWGVYRGNGEIIHLAGVEDDGIDGKLKPQHLFTISGLQFNKARVCIDNFWDIVDENKAYKNNNKDSKWRSLDPERIVRNAMSKLGKIGYNVLWSNCEHFANWCRYGEFKSDQVDNAVTGLAVGVSALLTVGAVAAIAKFWGGNKEEEEKEKQQRSQN